MAWFGRGLFPPLAISHMLVVALMVAACAAQPDPCSSLVGSLGLECAAFWVDLPSFVESAIYSTTLATWICKNPCLQPVIDMAVEFMSSECPGYQDVGFLFTFMSEFACLNNGDLPPQYCIGFLGPALNAYSENNSLSQPVCLVFAGAGCCFMSFIDVEIPAINLGFMNRTGIATIRNIARVCNDTYGIQLMGDSCEGGAHDPCQLPFDSIESQCLQYALQFPVSVDAIQANQQSNAALCEDPCLEAAYKLAVQLLKNRCSISTLLPWQKIFSLVSFMANLGCNRNQDGQFCMALTYSIFVQQGLLQTPSQFTTMAANDDDLDILLSVQQCQNITTEAACCLGSFLNVRIPAEFEFFSIRASALVSEVVVQCPALGVNVSEVACSNSHVDNCTQYLANVPAECQAFALEFPAFLQKAQYSANINNELCTNQCLPYATTIIDALTAHKDCYLGVNFNQMSGFDHVFNFSCQSNGQEFCLSAVALLLETFTNPLAGQGMIADDDDGDDDYDDDDDSASMMPSNKQCQYAQQAGCCFASLLALGYSGTQAMFLPLRALTSLYFYETACETYGITLTTTTCDVSAVVSPCTPLLLSLSPQCLVFLSTLNNNVRTINDTDDNYAICSHPCYHNTSIAIYSLILGGCNLEFAGHRRAGQVLDAAWYACQQQNTSFCWLSFFEFVRDLAVPITLSTCQTAQELGCCLGSAALVEWSMYFSSLLNKSQLDNLGALPGACSDLGLQLDLYPCGVSPPAPIPSRTLAYIIGGSCAAVVVLVIAFFLILPNRRKAYQSERERLLVQNDGEGGGSRDSARPTRRGQTRFEPLSNGLA